MPPLPKAVLILASTTVLPLPAFAFDCDIAKGVVWLAAIKTQEVEEENDRFVCYDDRELLRWEDDTGT